MSKKQSVRLFRKGEVAKHLEYFDQVCEQDGDDLQVAVDGMMAVLAIMSEIGVEHESVIEIVSNQWSMANEALEEFN
jgi:hypothetical protein